MRTWARAGPGVRTNLVANALKYSPAGGDVDVDVEPLEDAVRLRVRDPGIGLSPEELAGLFTPYQRAEGARGFQELGLGLSICRAIVEAHGGTITVQSAGRGRGTTFTVLLPRGLVAAPEALHAPAP